MSIYVVSHKKIDLADELPDGYIPFYVGPNRAELAAHRGVPDGLADNIASMNSSFCELTAMYWIWKNDKSQYKGLVHYRRLFTSKKTKEILKPEEICSILSDKKIIVPEKYWLLQTVKKHYSKHHNFDDLKMLRSIVNDLYPSYINAFDKCMKMKYVYPYNMLIAKSDDFDHYCSWLFPLLFELKRRNDLLGNNDISDVYQRRVYGFLSERLMNVYLQATDLHPIETPVLLTEKNLKRDISMNLASILNSRGVRA